MSAFNSEEILVKSTEPPDLETLAREFDADFYRAGNPDVDFAQVEPLAHFAEIGWREGRDPAPWFSVDAYLARHVDVQQAALNPFLHFLVQGRQEAREISASRPAANAEPLAPAEPAEPLPEGEAMRSEFDADFYRAGNPDVDFAQVEPLAHFAETGWREGRDPAPWFSVEAYLARHVDVRQAQLNPFLHYLVQGRREAREVFASESGPQIELASPTPPEPDPSPDLDTLRAEFDAAFYQARNPDVDFSRVEPFVHFAEAGWREGRDPAPWFSVNAYLAHHADVRQAALNPFLHYLVQGRREAREVSASGVAPLAPAPSEATAAVTPAARRPRVSDRLPTLASAGLTETDLDAVAEFFDEDYYLKESPELKDAPFDLVAHYMTVGYKQLLNPSSEFDTAFYLASNPDIAKAGINPFLHYVRNGRRELRPSASYSKLRLPKYRPLVSVIVPNYNHAAFLRDRLASIFDQTYRNIEIILLDDHSSDDSVAVLDELAAASPFPVKKAYNQINSGNVFAQWERGFTLVEGELVWICESDDTCEPDTLEHLVPKFVDRSVMLAFGRIQFCDAEGRIFSGLDNYREKAEPGIWARPITRHASEWFGGAFGRNNVIANVGGCLIRKQTLSPAIWDEARTYRICGDWYLYIQLAAGGCIAFDPRAVTYFRQHGRNTSASNFDKLYYYKEHGRILECLEKNWALPVQTREGFLAALSHSWRHHGMLATNGDFFVALGDFNKPLLQRREHYVLGSLGFTLGGGELFPIFLANELVRLGRRVSLLCNNLNDINEEILARLDSRVPVYDGAQAKIEGPRAFLNRIGATLVHSHVINIDDLFFKNAHPLENFPYVVTLHGSHQGGDLNIDMLLLRMLRKVTSWVYLAERNLDIFKGAPLDYSAFEKIPNAMPADPRPFPRTRAELGIDEDTVVFTFVARGVQQKGWRAAVEGLKLLIRQLPDVKVHVLMAGSGAKAEEVAANVEPGLPITFLGFQSCINGLYRISDVALAPTRFGGESYPLCIIQALQEGVPVIATRVGEIPAMIARDGEAAGVLIDNIRESPAFFQHVADAMAQMLDPATRARAAQIARDLRPQFDMDVMAQRYLAVYQKAIQRASAPAPARRPRPARNAVLVIGAAGFIGSHVAARLAREGADVVGLATRRPPNVAFSRFHIGRSELVSELIAAIEGCDTVVFAGGSSRPGSPMRSLGAEIDSEACHLMDIAELCGARGVKRFVFTSSGEAIYGRTNVARIAETHPTRPINSYGLAKLAAEHGLRLVASRTGMEALSLRVANPYGPGQVVKGAQGFVAAALRAVREGAPLEIWGDGSVTRDFIHIDDVASAFVAAISRDAGVDALNIGSGTGASLREIVDLVRELSGAPLEVTYKPARAVDAPSVVLDIREAQDRLAWRPTVGLREGLQATLAAHEETP